MFKTQGHGWSVRTWDSIPLVPYVTFCDLIRPPAAWAPKVCTAIRAYTQALGFTQGCPWRPEVFKTRGRGWSVRSWDTIPSGAYVTSFRSLIRP